MKQFVLCLLGGLLGVTLALFFYERWVVQPREAPRQVTTRVDLLQAAREAEAITANIDASVQRSVEHARNAHDALEAQASDQLKRSLVAEALALTQRYKIALTEAFMSNGQWPVTAAEAGLPQRDTQVGGALSSIEVGDQGMITLHFDQRFATGSWLRLVPQADKDSYRVRWRCLTGGDPDLQRYLAQCSPE